MYIPTNGPEGPQTSVCSSLYKYDSRIQSFLYSPNGGVVRL
jgi:hypothetical protein